MRGHQRLEYKLGWPSLCEGVLTRAVEREMVVVRGQEGMPLDDSPPLGLNILKEPLFLFLLLTF